MPLNDLLIQLEAKTGYKPRHNGKGYSARCPCPLHNDKKASLSISEKPDGKMLIHCHAGCTYAEICQELGITSESISNRKTADTSYEYYYYHDENKNILYRKIKTPLKKFYFEKFQNGKWVSGLAGVHRIIYNFPEVYSAIRENKIIAVVEGEKDVETLKSHGYVATTNDTGGGKSKWNKSHSEYLRCKFANVWRDLPVNSGRA